MPGAFPGCALTAWKKYAIISKPRRCGGIGRHKGLKIPRRKKRTGSIPVTGTKKRDTPNGGIPFLIAVPGSNPSKCNSPVGCCLPPARWRQHLNFCPKGQKCKSIPTPAQALASASAYDVPAHTEYLLPFGTAHRPFPTIIERVRWVRTVEDAGLYICLISAVKHQNASLLMFFKHFRKLFQNFCG